MANVIHGFTGKGESEMRDSEDALVGYIMRNTRDKTLVYDDVKAVLDAEKRFHQENSEQINLSPSEFHVDGEILGSSIANNVTEQQEKKKQTSAKFKG